MEKWWIHPMIDTNRIWYKVAICGKPHAIKLQFGMAIHHLFPVKLGTCRVNIEHLGGDAVKSFFVLQKQDG